MPRKKKEYQEDDFLLFAQGKENPKPKAKKRTTKAHKFDFLANLIMIGVDEIVAKDWLQVRKDKKASNTQTALEFTIRELDKIKEKYGVSYTDALTVCVVRNWMGCRCSFFENVNFQEYGITPEKPQIPTINFNYGKNNQRGYQRPEIAVRPFTEADEQNHEF